MGANHKEMDKAAKGVPYPTPLPIDKLLSQLLDSIKPIDLKAVIFPESLEIADEIETIKKSVFNDDGTTNDDNKIAAKEYFRLQKKLESFKITDAKIIVTVVDQVNLIAEKNSWGLSRFDGSIYVFNGCYHEPVTVEMFHSFLGNAALRLGVERLKASYHIFRDNLLSQYMSGNYIDGKKSDDKVVKLNVKNGTLHIDQDGKRELKPFDKNDFLKYQLSFEYSLDAKSPIWDKFLLEVLPDESLRFVLAEFLSSIFLPNSVLKIEKIGILFGTGKNGKSVVYEVLTALLGSENITSYSLQNLTSPTDGTYRARIKDALLNFSSELSTKLDPNILKALASGETMECKTLYKMPTQMSDYARLMSNANSLPTDLEQTAAFFRRFLVIPFLITIPDEKVDVRLPSKIIANELPGVLLYILAGLDRLLSQGRLTKSEAIDKTLEDYRTESDSVRMFLSESGYTKSDTDRILQTALYILYKDYAIENGNNAVNMKNFKKRILGMGIRINKESAGMMVYVGSKRGSHDF